jgi:hypothetical protein
MTFWDFASQHWWIALCMVWVAFSYVTVTINRIFRHWNIRKHGYPPKHCVEMKL